MNWRLQNPKGFRENIYTNKGFRRTGVSKIQRVSGKNIYPFNELASPKSKGFQGKYRHKYDLDQISSSVYSATTSVTSPLSWKSGPMGERTPREDIRVWELIIRESADFTLLIIDNPGALVTFF